MDAGAELVRVGVMSVRRLRPDRGAQAGRAGEGARPRGCRGPARGPARTARLEDRALRRAGPGARRALAQRDPKRPGLRRRTRPLRFLESSGSKAYDCCIGCETLDSHDPPSRRGRTRRAHLTCLVGPRGRASPGLAPLRRGQVRAQATRAQVRGTRRRGREIGAAGSTGPQGARDPARPERTVSWEAAGRRSAGRGRPEAHAGPAPGRGARAPPAASLPGGSGAGRGRLACGAVGRSFRGHSRRRVPAMRERLPAQLLPRAPEPPRRAGR